MKKLLLLSLTLVSFFGQAQIQVTSSDFPAAGDTIRVSVAVGIETNFLATGPNHFWDYTSLVLDSQRVTDYRPVSETNLFLVQPYFGSFADAAHQASYYNLITDFPLATISAGITIDKVSQFSKLTSSSLNNVGFSAEISGFPLAVPSDTIETVYKLPLTYQSTWNSRGYSAMDLAGLDLAFKQYRTRSSEVDGWGSISTPYGTFDVLRVKHIITETDSVKITIDSLVGPQWIGFPLPERHDYEWIAVNQKEPILRISTTVFAGFETTNSLVYRDIYREPSVGLQNKEANSTKIYPNPTNGVFTVNNGTEISSYEILGIDGKILRQEKVKGTNISIDIQSLDQGMYQVRLTTKSGIQHKSIYKL